MDKSKSILFGLVLVFGILLSLNFVAATIDELTNSPADNTVDEDAAVTFIATFNATLNETVTCTLDFTGGGPGASSYTSTVTNTSDSATGKIYTCNHALTDMPSDTYYWTISATNVSDTTTTTSRNLQVDTGGGRGFSNLPVTISEEEPGAGSKGLYSILIVAIVAGVAFLLFKKK